MVLITKKLFFEMIHFFKKKIRSPNISLLTSDIPITSAPQPTNNNLQLLQ